MNNILSYFHTYKVEDITGVNTNISADMYQAIELWANMMSGRAPWNADAPACGILPQISGRLSNFVTREIGLQVDNEAIARPMEHLNHNADKLVEYIALLGGGLVRPLYANNKLQYEVIPLGNYLPTKYDFDGSLTGAIILKQLTDAGKNYILTEVHDYDGVSHNVSCRLYANDKGVLKAVPLTACASTADVTPQYSWSNCSRPMVVEFRNHATNKIDGSNVPVSLIAGCEKLIEEADRQLARMDWEQEAGEKRIFADGDMFQKRRTRDGNGNTTGVEMTKSLNKLIVKVDGDGSAQGDKIHEYSPELRTEAQEKYLQVIFKRIEQAINLGKGSISDAEAVQQTATQYSGGRQELYAIVDRIEDEIAVKLQECADIFAYMAAAYKIGPNDSTITIKWNDDQTRKDMQQAKVTALQEINAGVKNKWEYRRDFFGEDEETAKANVPPEPAFTTPFDLA